METLRDECTRRRSGPEIYVGRTKADDKKLFKIARCAVRREHYFIFYLAPVIRINFTNSFTKFAIKRRHNSRCLS